MLIKNIILKFLIALSFAIALIGCKPRGETITLDQSLEISKERYAQAITVSKTKLAPEIVASLDTIKASLDRLERATSSAGYQQETKAIAETIKPLMEKAGYASRPALDEIMKQCNLAAENTHLTSYANATARLLAQRTYHVLSAELETTRFAVQS